MDLTNKKIGYNFKDKDLFILALTHKSASRRNNERLEFLGDSIINFYIAKELIRLFPNLNEGKLTQIRASLVSRNFLNNMAKELKISKQLVLGKGETTENNSILGNALEAIIGAIYLDSDLNQSMSFLAKLYKKSFKNIEPNKDIKDSKSRLQEDMQKKGYKKPFYEVIDHGDNQGSLRFEAFCKVVDLDIQTKGWGKTRKSAEQEAASVILQLYLNSGK